MQVSKLEPHPRGRGRFLLHLEDGTTLKVGEGEVVAFALGAGVELDDQTLAALTAAARMSGLRERAISALASRPMSRRQLLEKLRGWGAGDREGREIADRMEQLGLLNDGEYARMLVAHSAAKTHGPYRIKEDLYRTGIDRALWEDALAEVPDPAPAIDAFLRKRLKGAPADPKALKRASDALARRGYGWEDIRDGLRRYGETLAEDGWENSP